MNVTVVGHEQVDRVESLEDISNYLFKKIVPALHGKLNPAEAASLDYATFAPDGDDYDKETGVINFYTKELSEPTIANILKGVEYWLHEIGCTMGKPTRNTHGDKIRADLDRIHKYGDDEFGSEYPEIVPKTVDQKKQEYMAHAQSQGLDHTKVRVVRIPIIHRDRTKQPRDMVPELNLSNTSAHYIFGQALGFQHTADDHGSGYGPISVRDLLIKVEHLTAYQKQKLVTPDQTQQDQGKVTMFTQGYSEERIERILQQIAQICRWAIKNGHDYIQVY